MARLDDVLAKDHPARAVWEFVEALDLAELKAQVRAIEGRAGRPAIDPAVLLSLWLYGVSQGAGERARTRAALQGARRLPLAPRGRPVNYHTRSDFPNQGDAFDRLLSALLASLTKSVVLRLERAARAGMRVRASAGGASPFHRRTMLDAHPKAAEAQLEALRSRARVRARPSLGVSRRLGNARRANAGSECKAPWSCYPKPRRRRSAVGSRPPGKPAFRALTRRPG